MPVLLARAIVGLALDLEHLHFAFLIGLGYHAYLRTGELLRLQVRDIDIQPSCTTGVVNIQASKSGLRFNTREAVAIYDLTLIRMWELVLLQTPRQPHDRLWPGSGTSFRQTLRDYLTALQVDHCNFQAYSLRRGGATNHFMSHRTVEAILIRGRWRSLGVARLYLEDGMSHLTTLSFSSSALTTLRSWAALLPAAALS